MKKLIGKEKEGTETRKSGDQAVLIRPEGGTSKQEENHSKTEE